MKAHRRLYVASKIETLKWCVANNIESAKEQLGDDARIPNSDDVRAFWSRSGIALMSPKEIDEAFGVTRQTVHNWRVKAGPDFKSFRQSRKEERVRKLALIIQQLMPASAFYVSRITGLDIRTVLSVARQSGIQLKPAKRMPDDATLIELAKGRTWYELSDATGLCLGRLRTHIYARPELAAAIRAVRKPLPFGRKAHGKVDPEKLAELVKKGMTAYAIAKELRVEAATITSRLKYLAKRKKNVKKKRSVKRASRKSVDGGNGGNANQPR